MLTLLNKTNIVQNFDGTSIPAYNAADYDERKLLGRSTTVEQLLDLVKAGSISVTVGSAALTSEQISGLSISLATVNGVTTIPPVESVANLRDISSVNLPDLANVLCSVKQTIYAFDNADTNPDDGDVFILPNDRTASTPGRWIAKVRSGVTVGGTPLKDHGAPFGGYNSLDIQGQLQISNVLGDAVVRIDNVQIDMWGLGESFTDAYARFSQKTPCIVIVHPSANLVIPAGIYDMDGIQLHGLDTLTPGGVPKPIEIVVSNNVQFVSFLSVKKIRVIIAANPPSQVFTLSNGKPLVIWLDRSEILINDPVNPNVTVISVPAGLTNTVYMYNGSKLQEGVGLASAKLFTFANSATLEIHSDGVDSSIGKSLAQSANQLFPGTLTLNADANTGIASDAQIAVDATVITRFYTEQSEQVTFSPATPARWTAPTSPDLVSVALDQIGDRLIADAVYTFTTQTPIAGNATVNLYVPINDPEVGSYIVRIAGITSDGSEGASIILANGYRYAAATMNLFTFSTILDQREDAGWSALLTFQANTLQVFLVGDATFVVDWRVTIEVTRFPVT